MIIIIVKTYRRKNISISISYRKAYCMCMYNLVKVEISCRFHKPWKLPFPYFLLVKRAYNYFIVDIKTSILEKEKQDKQMRMRETNENERKKTQVDKE